MNPDDIHINPESVFFNDDARNAFIRSVVESMKEEIDDSEEEEEDTPQTAIERIDQSSQTLPVRDKAQELFELADILRKIISEYIEEETGLLAERDEFVRGIRYEDKTRLNNLLTDQNKFSRYGLNDTDEETVLKRVSNQKDQELQLPQLKKSIVKLKEFHKSLISIAYDLRSFEQRKR